MKHENLTIDGINFNTAHANKVSEEQFLKDHDHHKDDTDLKAAYKTLRAKPVTKAAPAPAEETKK